MFNMSMISEFKSFAMKGSVLDLAIGVIIGGAFGAIVSSLVGDILMPIFGILTGGIDFSGLHAMVGSANVAYGKFVQAAVNFLIVAWALFMVVKGINSVKKKEEEKPAPPPAPTKEEVLLTEIRDALRSR
jgi:large conductance mechanosensitive channel